MKRPWWARRNRAEDESERELGEPGPGKVLVVTERDYSGHPLTRTWIAEDIAWQWDETRWSGHL